MKNGYNNYDKSPEIRIEGAAHPVCVGYDEIVDALRQRIRKDKWVLVLDAYPGVNLDEVTRGLDGLGISERFCSETVMISSQQYLNAIRDTLTEDRVFGRMSDWTLSKLLDDAAVDALREKINAIQSGVVLVYGVGASLITRGDVHIYADMARWEIQNRFKAGMANFHTDNADAPFLSKFKQGYFVEWRMADRHKASVMQKIDYLLDTHTPLMPKMITGDDFRMALRTAAKRPFRLVPYFDPGVWGGKWIEQVCDLEPRADNYAWCFDGVPEENSLYLRIGDARIEIPAMDLVLYCPQALLGERVFEQFGAEFPIRFDFLDTMQGGNLSLQVHPTASYIKEHFGMNYTQDESYYILDCEADGCVYLGLKPKIDKQEMISALQLAQNGKAFDVQKYVNKLPVRPHDHFHIPAGTVHCSGRNAMVLEISATPYIFTFKLYDWNRLGLDGLPRPIHIEHGAAVICWERDTDWVMENLVDQQKVLQADEHMCEEYTGLHQLEFIETRRHTFDDTVWHDTNDSVNVLNLVEGEEAEIFSPNDAFPPFTVHYAETFIVPGMIGRYGVRPTTKSKGQTLKTIKAYIRTESFSERRKHV